MFIHCVSTFVTTAWARHMIHFISEYIFFIVRGSPHSTYEQVRVPGIESEEFGSEFYFTIPFEVLPEDEPVAPTEAEAAASSATTEGE